MVKPDPNHNYYADLDLPPSASVDDIRKAYRKLALQYHPDRNAGREGECVPRFQAIQAANEILSDPSVKNKYDLDRRRAGLSTLFRSPAPAATNNTQSWAAPPRRTADPTTDSKRYNWAAREAASNGQAPKGADRFTNFPRPNVPPRKDPAAQFRAWQNMNSGPERPRPAKPGPPPPPPPREPQPGSAPTRPRAQRQDTKLPSEDEIRAGMRYTGGVRPNGTNNNTPDSAEAKQSAWQAFHGAGTAERPGANRRKSRQTPKKPGGFDPNAPGSDERPAPQSGSRYFNRHRSEDLGRMFNGAPFPPPPPGPPPATTPESPLSPDNQPTRPMPDPLRPFKSRTFDEDAPFAEGGSRTSSPYGSFLGERTNVGIDGLRRSVSTRDTTRLRPQGTAKDPRARSNSPASRRQPLESDSDSDEPGLTNSPQEYGSPQTSPHRPAPTESTTPIHDRPKKKPVPRSGRFSANYTSTSSLGAQSADESIPATDDGPSMQQKPSSQNMYVSQHFPSTDVHPISYATSSFPLTEPDATRPAGQAVYCFKYPKWAIPSSVFPPRSLCVKREQRHSTERQPESDHTGEQAQAQQNYLGGEKVSDVAAAEFAFNLASKHQDFTPAGSRNRSEEHINTNFSPEPWNGSFTGSGDYFAGANVGRKGSPAIRGGNRTKSTIRSATTDLESPMQSSNMPPPPMRPFGSDGTFKQPSDASFTASDWHNHFQDASWAWPSKDGSSQTAAAGSSAADDAQPPKLTPDIEKTAPEAHRDAEQMNVPEEATRQNVTDNPSAPPRNPSIVVDDGDMMDIDSSPNTGIRSTTSQSQTSQEPRLYAVPQSNWHHTQQATQRNGKHPNAPPKKAQTGLKTSLRDFSTVEPLGPPVRDEGLAGMSDMASSLPFQSQSSAVPPNFTKKPQKLEVPAKPKAPDVPQTLTKLSWQNHLKAFSQYVKAYHIWNHQMLDHFNQREKMSEERIAGGMGWLEASGETSGTGLWTYIKEAKEDEQVRDAWNVAWEKHVAALEDFEKLRERVKELSLSGRLQAH